MPRITPSRPTQETSTTVAIRLRPLNDREKEAGQSRIWRCVPTHNSVTLTSADGNPLPDGKGTFFTYDRIFDEDSSTEAVYDGTAKEIVHSVSQGMNGTIFAYGQTSSGKTFTMQGGGSESTPGIVQIATQDLFRLIQEKTDRMFLMRVSYLEIYQEEIRDLLNPENTNMQVREDPRKGVYIDAHEETVGDFETVLKILKMGDKQRHVGCTEMNSRSSRSHTIFRLVVESQQMYDDKVHASQDEVDPSTLVATLNLVDLAGSESVRHTGATGIRQKEGGMINQSLLTLSRVIQTLTQPGNSHVNYRDSKLTRILQPSLSGNARMAIICCATAAEGFLEETRSTFQFASRAKEIKTRAVVNEVVDDKTQIRRMSQELAALKRKHAEQQAAAEQGGGNNNAGLVEALRQEKAEQADKIDRLKKLLLNIAPTGAVQEEEGEPVLNFHLDLSPRVRRGKRSRETWCPGGSVNVVTAPRPLRLLNSNLNALGAIDEGESEHLSKRRLSEAAESTAPGARAVSGGRLSEEGSGSDAAAEGQSAVVANVPASGGVEAIAAKLEEALAAKQETDEEMQEFVAYTEDVERVLASTKALLAQEVEAAQEAAGAVAAAKAAADAAALREQEVTTALQERIAALEADKAELEEQEAVLRAENEEAVAIMAGSQARVPSLADADVQTDDVDPGEATGAQEGSEVDASGRGVSDLQARIAERDATLVDLQGRVAELEASLAEAREQQREQEVRGKEEKQQADESLIEALAGQRRAEDAFSAACQSELEMRCRLESALQQTQEAEQVRDEMLAKVEEHETSSCKQQEEIESLGRRLQAAEKEAASVSTTAEEVKTAAVKETDAVRRKLLAHEAASSAKNRTIQELMALVDSLKADAEKTAIEEAGQGDDSRQQREEQLLADKQRGEEEAAAARAENDALAAKIEELSQQLALEESEASSARQELDAAKGAASEAEAKFESEMARVVEEALASSLQLAAAKTELETKVEDAVRLADKIQSLESQVKAAEEAALEREATHAARIADTEIQLDEAKVNAVGQVTGSADTEGASESEGLLAEVESELTAANELVASLQAAAAEHQATSSARISELESEVSSANESLASAQEAHESRLAALSENEELLCSRVAELESELASANESLAAAQTANQDKVAVLSESKESLRSRVTELESDLEAANKSLGDRLEAAKEAAASEKEGELKAATDELRELVATAQDAATKSQKALDEKTSLADGLAADLGALREEISTATSELDALREAAATTTSQHETEIGEVRAELEQAKMSLAAKDDEVARVQHKADEEAREAREAASASAEALAEKEAAIASMKKSMEAVEGIEGELTQALEDSESLSKEVLDLTDQLVQKDARLVQLQKQIQTVTAELSDAQAAAAAAAAAASSAAHTNANVNANANSDGFYGETAETSSELRRLRVELDKKGSELDTAMKKHETVRAELKEVRDMLSAAANAAGAAGADEESLRKRVSQLACENGLLKGEKERQESLAADARAEAKSNASRLAAEVERLEREVKRLSAVAGKASGAAEDGGRARAALEAMEAKLSEVRQERAELQEASQRSLGRCSEAEREIETLKSRLAELEGRDSNRDAFVALETKVDELEQALRRAAASKADIESDAREQANRAKRLQGEVEMMRSEYEVVSEEASGLRGSLAGAEAKLEEALAAQSASSEDRSAELEAEIARLRERMSELGEAHLQALRDEEGRRLEMQKAHNESVAALEEKINESLELAEQIEADQDSNLEALRAQLATEHAGELDALRARLEEALKTAEAKGAEALELSEECDALSAELKRVGDEARSSAGGLEERLEAAEEARVAVEEALAETVAAGKATEEQLRHRLTAQVAEAENLRQELLDTRQRSDQAEAAVRDSEQRAREGADEKTKKLLVEMENLCQEKLIAENKAGDMETELERLRMEVATAEQTAAKDQGMLIRAAEERMAVLDKAAEEKDVAIAELQASLDTARLSASTEAEVAAAAEVEKATEALNAKIAALTATTAEYQETIKKQEARIKKLELVRLTNGQVEKLQAMKASAKKTAAENTELKQRLAVFKERLEATADAGAGADARSVGAALAAATERNAELQGAKDTLVEKMKEYGKRVYELEKEHARVRAAVKELGGSVPEGGDLGDAVLDCAERFVGGRGGCDGSMMSTGSHDEAVAAAAAARASEEVQQELGEAREALRKEQASKAVLKEQIMAGVAKFRALEAQEKATRERLEQVEMEQRGTVIAAVKKKEKEHERKHKFLEEENVQLFNEITASKAKIVEYTAEIKTLKEKLTQQAPKSVSNNKGALGDRTNNTSTSADVDANPSARKIPQVQAQPAAAAERRAASRALIDGEGPVDEEGPGECNQS
eukprot:g11463.t1